MSTPQERKEVYATKHWLALRADVLRSAGWLCQCAECKTLGLTKGADMVHHVVPWQDATGRERQRLAFDRGNLLAVNRDCHAKIHSNNVAPNPWDGLVAQTLNEVRS